MYKHIETSILPKNCCFTPQQEKVIKYDDSCNVVAGPGSGKTTTLLAKCGLILSRIKSESKGICLITHTNVAANEIKYGLKKIGYDEIFPPHFIGTIHEFINKFYTRKAFHKILGNIKMNILENGKYSSQFKELFMELKPNGYTYNSPDPFKKNVKLVIDGDDKVHVISNAPSFYENAFNTSIKQLFYKGIITNEQCLDIALWYIKKDLQIHKSAVQNRFSHILLDEAQDTGTKQFEIINLLTEGSEIIFQKFGDPFQSLYNIYGNNKEVWDPFDTNEIKLEISSTSRFSNNIVNVIDNLSKNQYDNFSSRSINNSFSPYCIVYDNSNDLIEKYEKTITKLEGEREDFRNSNREDFIVSVKHKDLENNFKDYSKENSKSSKERIEKILINYIFDEVEQKEKVTAKELKMDNEFKVGIAQMIKGLLNDDELEIKKVKIVQILKKYFGYRKEYFEPSEIIGFYCSMNRYHFATAKSMYKLGTVHSVKGETHRSTMLVANSFFNIGYDGSKHAFADLIFPFMLDGYKIDENIDNLYNQALKLAYVALSRPMYLMILAVPRANFKESYKKDLCSSGWIVID